jgi:hypothetical protein
VGIPTNPSHIPVVIERVFTQGSVIILDNEDVPWVRGRDPSRAGVPPGLPLHRNTRQKVRIQPELGALYYALLPRNPTTGPFWIGPSPDRVGGKGTVPHHPVGKEVAISLPVHPLQQTHCCPLHPPV